MKVFYSSTQAKEFCQKGTAITMGNYDGLHLGHRSILALLKKEAKKRGVPAMVYTFHPHPVHLLAPSIAPPLINTLDQKIELMKTTGMDALVIEKFDSRFSEQSPEAFFKKHLVKNLNARFIIVGYDFTFGAKRKGNMETLEILGFQNQIDVKIVEPYFKGQTLVSSSLIRKYLLEGKVEKTKDLLTRSYFIDGVVVKGTRRGKILGFPTANLKTINELIPKNGVYATLTLFGGKNYPSVTNIGIKPTFGKNQFGIETHLLNFNKPLYGEKIRLYFIKRLRDEKKFSTGTQLSTQIKKDITRAKQYEKIAS